jgi:hypothetical protein
MFVGASEDVGVVDETDSSPTMIRHFYLAFGSITCMPLTLMDLPH